MPRHRKPPAKQKRRPAGSGSVLDRKDGRLAVVLPPEFDPRRRPIYGPGHRRPWASREQAEAWLAAEVSRLRNPTSRSATLSEPLGAYLARWYRINSPSWPERTARAYAVSLRRWAPIGHVRLGDLTREVVQGALADLQRATWCRRRKDGTPTSEPRPYSARTIQHARTLLYQALEDLIPDVLTYNPARSRRRSRATAAPEQPVWSADQAERFLATAERYEPQIALAFRLILRRALRTGECVALTWSDVDERASTLRIDETPGLKRGTSGPTKTRRVRDVPLSADLIARLRAHRRAYPSTSPHVFTVRGERISLPYFRRLWHRTVRVAQVPPISPKDGRATCATILLDEGVALPRVAALLGHASIATTSTFYARVLSSRQQRTTMLAEALDDALDHAGEIARGGEPTPLGHSTADQDEAAR